MLPKVMVLVLWVLAPQPAHAISVALESVVTAASIPSFAREQRPQFVVEMFFMKGLVGAMLLGGARLRSLSSRSVPGLESPLTRCSGILSSAARWIPSGLLSTRVPSVLALMRAMGLHFSATDGVG